MIKDKKFIYIASPFNHKDEKIRNERVEKAGKFLAYLQVKYAHKYVLFSPIVHSGNIYKYMPEKYHLSFDFWIHEIDDYFLEITDEIWILQIDGWYSSLGIKYEIKFAEKKGIPIILWRKEGNTYKYYQVE
jgi:hypothetical protein